MDTDTRLHPATPDPELPGVCLICQLPLDKPNRRHGRTFRRRRLADNRRPDRGRRSDQPTLF